MNEKFIIELCSDLDFEGMVIDISYDMEIVASINYDKGIDNIEIELHPIPEKLIFPLKDFLQAIEKAKKLAQKCAEEDEQRKKM